MLRVTFGCNREEVGQAQEDYIMRTSITCTPLTKQVKEDEIGRACSTHDKKRETHKIF